MTFSKESFHKSDFSANEFLTSCPRYPVGAPVNLSSSAWALKKIIPQKGKHVKDLEKA
jgi:hypothetical protein